jgi:hypothetical protein
MIYTVYRTTNKVNGKYYIGVHKTDNPMDEYLGSGKHLKYAIAKYGASNFTKEILLCSHSPNESFALEHELVEKHRGDPLCYNIRQGGAGGFDYINKVGLNGNAFKTKEVYDRARKTTRKRFENDPEYRARCREIILTIGKLVNPQVREASRKKATQAWKGGHQTPENCRKFSEMRTGEGNPNYGMRWINKDGDVRRVKTEELQEWIDNGWLRGKKEAVKKEPRQTLLSLAPEGTTWCSTHKQYLPVEVFHKDHRNKSGYKKYCIECRKKKREGKKW